MSTALVDLERLFPPRDGEAAVEGGPAGLRIEGHLPECPNPHHPEVGCDWCLSALSEAGVRRCADLARDARTLLADHERRGGDVSVAWVVAAGDVVDDVVDGADQTLVVPSVAELRDRVHRLVVAEILPLRRRIDVAVASGGPVESRCVRSAALLAGAALQRPEMADRLAALPSHLRETLSAASLVLPNESRASALLPVIESIHWDGLPTLRTQPEWRRRDRPTPSAPSGSFSDAPSAGSFEALVMEATMAEVTEQLTAIAPELVDSGDPVLHRLGRRPGLSAPTRRLTLRMGRIDWTLTFADSGRCRCWPRQGEQILVPWTVAVALREGERLGLMSATHGDAPDGGGHRA